MGVGGSIPSVRAFTSYRAAFWHGFAKGCETALLPLIWLLEWITGWHIPRVDEP